jgi:hypothetical protein
MNIHDELNYLSNLWQDALEMTIVIGDGPEAETAEEGLAALVLSRISHLEEEVS